MKNEKGFNLIELLVVISVVGIISAVAVPAYNDFVANARVRAAANDILQNMRTIKTMAKRDNRQYVMTFAGNTYTFGIDVDRDGVPENYRGRGAPQTVNLQTEYGPNIVFGSTPNTAPGTMDACGVCIAGLTGNPVLFGVGTAQTFMPDGSIASAGYVAVTDTLRNYTYMVRTFYLMGRIDMWRWDGNVGVPSPAVVTACGPADNPKRACAWTEAR